LGVESGDVSAKSTADRGPADPALRRLAETADLELTHSRVGGDWYFTGGVSGAHYDYGLDEYDVAGARAGLIYRNAGFNNFVLYRENMTDGHALLPFDEVRSREVDLQARVSLIPRVNHVVRAVYDMGLKDFDRLEVGTLLERRGYELGFYWDFARDRAGVELGIATP
jgi:hypothetical protein